MHASAATVDILYGRQGLSVPLPAAARPTVIGKRPLAVLADPHAAVREALAHPVDAPPYAELVRGRTSACILICDITRPVPNHLFLRPLIEGLRAAGMPRERITVLVATGLHRPNEGEELAEVVGDPWVFANVRVENHFARDDAAHVDLGVTPVRRTPVRSTGASSKRTCASPRAWSSRTSWPDGRAGARSSRRGSRTRTRSARSTAPASWRILRRSSATSSAIRCTRSSSPSCACWATCTRSTP